MDREQRPFIISVPPEQLRKEKEKASRLRGSQWWKRQIAKGVCYYCQRKTPPAELTMDHIVALIRGGKSSRGNVVPACRECNSQKKYLLPFEWEEYVRKVSAGAAAESENTRRSASVGCSGEVSRTVENLPTEVTEPEG
jgi:hypothetical protein